jgi:hypothetical protein
MQPRTQALRVFGLEKIYPTPAQRARLSAAAIKQVTEGVDQGTLVADVMSGDVTKALEMAEEQVLCRAVHLPD